MESGPESSISQSDEDWRAAPEMVYPAAYLNEAINHEYKITRLKDVFKEPVEWLWQGRIPRGAITMLDGDPEVGKSTLSLDLAARVSAGARLPDGARRHMPAPVLLVGAEDSLAATVRPRLEAAGAALQHVHALEAVYTEEQPLGRPLRLPTDNRALHRAIMQTEAVLVIIDPLMSFIDAEINSSIDQDVRKVLWPLAQTAEQTGAAIMIVRHLTKGSTGGPVIYRGGGSMGIIGAARSGLMAFTDLENDRSGETKVLAHTKSNLSRKAVPLDYKIVADPQTGIGKVEWLV